MGKKPGQNKPQWRYEEALRRTGMTGRTFRELGPYPPAGYIASSFFGKTITDQINNGIVRAKADGIKVLFIPDSMRGFDPNLVTFDPAVKMMIEGSSLAPDTFDVRAFGAIPDDTSATAILINRRAFQKAFDAASLVNGIVLVPSASFWAIDVNTGGIGPLIAAANITIRGEVTRGSGSVSLQFMPLSHTNGTDIDFIRAGNNVRFENLRLVGPITISGANSNVHLIRVTGTDGTIVYVDNCRFEQYTFAIWCSDNGTSVEVCDSYWAGFDGTRPCTGLLTSGSSGTRRVHLYNCELRNHGLVGSNLYHGLYIDDQVELMVDKCRFFNHFGNGFYAQIHDGVTAAKKHIFRDCYFGPQNANDGTSHGIQTSNLTPCEIINCTFDMKCQAIELDGHVLLRGCTFYGQAGLTANNFMMVATENNAQIDIDGCYFVGASENPILIDWNTTKWRIRGCHFIGTMIDGIVLGSGIASTTFVVVEDCDFSGPTGNCVKSSGSGHLIVKGNRFLPALGAAVNCIRLDAGTLTSFQMLYNDFEQGGTVDNSLSKAGGAVMAAGWIGLANTGSKGFKTENSGVVSAQDASLIAHGLGNVSVSVTPTRFGVSPTGAGGNRIASVVGKDGTNLTLDLVRITGATGDPILVNENVSWWAAQ